MVPILDIIPNPRGKKSPNLGRTLGGVSSSNLGIVQGAGDCKLFGRPCYFGTDALYIM
ncbi:hypothetical protein CDL12_28010 [Handroanthus impetiginosus]|uniref:Uncharacterized protein n=1 Tax=Handroanthus impetiginosus TaxID=429701 RepID=A0A2G9G3L4_9LAMI|nr:hypothetical protein CDL12_28010 [Handroanthus impetiginosus]